MARPGRHQLRVSYLSVGLNWSADYVARLAPDGASLDLTGWITLANRTSISFQNAPTAVVAGRLSRVPVQRPQAVATPVTLHCWPSETTHSGWPPPPPPPPPPVAMAAMDAMPAPPPAMRAAGMVVVTAHKRVTQSNLGDYKLYTLAEPTTVAARQTKQVQFLDKPGVKFETVYVDRINAWPGYAPDPEQQQPTTVTLRLENKAVSGLGEALPAGQVSVRRPGDGRELFVGAYAVRDVPVGEPF